MPTQTPYRRTPPEPRADRTPVSPTRWPLAFEWTRSGNAMDRGPMQPASQLQPGTLIADRYRVESLLGSGGHAFVYLAIQEKLGRKVALKVLKMALPTGEDQLTRADQQVLIKRFEQEARLISQLRDPHTITMYDYGNTHDGLLYMVCEYVEGESLKDLLIREGKLQPARVMHILEQLLLSLQEAHAYGVLHRDLKPDNIMVYTHLGRRDQVKLLDFGIAKISMGDSPDNDLTAEGSLVGTPRYIAPERIRGEELRPASDLYSLGLVAYEALTGKRVLDGLHGIRALQAQLGDPSLRLPDDLDIDTGFRHIIERMIEKDLPIRYQVAEQVLHDLARVGRGESLVAEEFDLEATHEAGHLLHEPLPVDRTEQLQANRSTRPGDVSEGPLDQPAPRLDTPEANALRTASAHHENTSSRSSSHKKPGRHASKKNNQTTIMIVVILALVLAILLAIAFLSFLLLS